MSIFKSLGDLNLSIQVVMALLLVITIVMLTGNGGWLILGKNINKHNPKLVSRIIGVGLAIICVLLFIILFMNSLVTAKFFLVALLIILVDCLAMIIYINHLTKKK